MQLITIISTEYSTQTTTKDMVQMYRLAQKVHFGLQSRWTTNTNNHSAVDFVQIRQQQINKRPLT